MSSARVKRVPKKRTLVGIALVGLTAFGACSNADAPEPKAPGVTAGPGQEPGSTATTVTSSDGTAAQPDDGTVAVKGTVASVSGNSVRLTQPDRGIALIELTSSTEYRLSEGEDGTVADVVAGAQVLATGEVSGDRLRSSLLTVLTY